MIIRINLLPEEKRTAVKSKDTSRDLFQTNKALSIFIAIIVINFVGFAFTKWTAIRSKSLNQELESLQPSVRRIQILKADLNKLKSKSATLADLIAGRFVWARLLNALSDILPAAIWLDEISLNAIEIQAVQSPKRKTKAQKTAVPDQKTKQILYISGYALSEGEDATALVGKFIQALKDDYRFQDAFEKIDLVSIRKKSVKETQVMNFKISCLFAKDVRYADL